MVSSVCDMKSMRYAGGAPNHPSSAASLNVAHRTPSDHPSKEGSGAHSAVSYTGPVSTLTRRKLLTEPERPQPQHSPPKVESPPQRAGAHRACHRRRPRGLSATRSLRHRGHDVRLFEASDRLGGRVWTLRGFWPADRWASTAAGSPRASTARCAASRANFGLPLENTLSYPVGTRDRYYFDGGRYPLAAATADWDEVFPIFRAAVRRPDIPRRTPDTPLLVARSTG